MGVPGLAQIMSSSGTFVLTCHSTAWHQDCQKDIQDNKDYLQKEYDKRRTYIAQHKAAVRVQSIFRGRRHRNHYDKCRKGATKLAACLRGKQNREKFNNQFSGVGRHAITVYHPLSLQFGGGGGALFVRARACVLRACLYLCLHDTRTRSEDPSR
jgi:hypothetical protein